MELRDLAAAHGDRPTGPVARLSAYDAEHGTNLVETLRAWLDAFGDVAAASAAMFVHANTFRYRLRRLTEVSGIDLGDPEQRFAAMLQLRAIYPAGNVSLGYRPRALARGPPLALTAHVIMQAAIAGLPDRTTVLLSGLPVTLPEGSRRDRRLAAQD